MSRAVQYLKGRSSHKLLSEFGMGRPADPEEEADREADRFIEDFREALKRL